MEQVKSQFQKTLGHKIATRLNDTAKYFMEITSSVGVTTRTNTIQYLSTKSRIRKSEVSIRKSRQGLKY